MKTQKRIPILDNGHGIDTIGKRTPLHLGTPVIEEWAFNRNLVDRIAKLCENEVIQYHLLVPEPTDVDLRERCNRVNQLNSKNDGMCFLFSIHANAGGGTGWECFTTKGETESDHIASILVEEFKKEFGSEFPLRADYSDGDPDKEEQFYILKHTTCPAVLTENFFMDNFKDVTFMLTEKGKDRIAKFHFEAIKRLIYE